jgi:HEAT repeat protein
MVALFTSGFDWPGKSQRLAAALDHASARERRDIVRLLATYDDEVAHEALERALVDKDENIRREAIEAVARVGLKRAAKTLLAAMSDPEPSLRVAAIESLGALRSMEARAPLTRALSDPDPHVRVAAVSALGKVAEPSDLALLLAALDDSDLDVRVQAVHVLADFDEERVRTALIGKTRDAANEVRRAALDELSTRADPRIEGLLIDALEDNNEAVVLTALRALRDSKSSAVFEAVRALSRSDRPRIRTAAALVSSSFEAREREAKSAADPTEPAWLGWLEQTVTADQEQTAAVVKGLEESLPRNEALAAAPLVAWLDRVPSTLRARVILLLGRTGWAPAAPRVVAALNDPQPEVRRAAALALEQIAARGQDRALVQALADRDATVREAASHALQNVGGRDALKPLVSATIRQAPHARARLAALCSVLSREQRELETKTRERLRNALVDSALSRQEEEATLAIDCLGRLADDTSVNALINLNTNVPLQRRVAIVRALSAVQTKEALVVLRRATKDEYAPIAASAVAALGEIGTSEDAALIQAASAVGPWPLGPNASYALASLVSRGLADPRVLCAPSTSPEPITRQNARATLAKHPPQICGDTEQPPPPSLHTALQASRPTQPWVALERSDGRVLISHRDGTGSAAWPGFKARLAYSPWSAPYGH